MSKRIAIAFLCVAILFVIAAQFPDEIFYVIQRVVKPQNQIGQTSIVTRDYVGRLVVLTSENHEGKFILGLIRTGTIPKNDFILMRDVKTKALFSFRKISDQSAMNADELIRGISSGNPGRSRDTVVEFQGCTALLNIDSGGSQNVIVPALDLMMFAKGQSIQGWWKAFKLRRRSDGEQVQCRKQAKKKKEMGSE